MLSMLQSLAVDGAWMARMLCHGTSSLSCMEFVGAHNAQIMSQLLARRGAIRTCTALGMCSRGTVSKRASLGGQLFH